MNIPADLTGLIVVVIDTDDVYQTMYDLLIVEQVGVYNHKIDLKDLLAYGELEANAIFFLICCEVWEANKPTFQTILSSIKSNKSVAVLLLVPSDLPLPEKNNEFDDYLVKPIQEHLFVDKLRHIYYLTMHDRQFVGSAR